MDAGTSSSSLSVDPNAQGYANQPPPPNPHLANHGYYYASPHQLYPFMSIFYANVHQQRNQQPMQPQDAQTLMNKYWMERNINSPPHHQPPQSLSNVVAEAQDAMDSGYWNLPKPQYGPMASKRECKEKPARIGEQYQAVIPPLRKTSTCNKSEAVDPAASIFEDHCVWECDKVPRRQLDEYLKIVQFVMGTSRDSVYTDCHYDEAKALYLLKLHNYNIRDTLHTLNLQKPDRSNPNFQWLYTKRNASTTSGSPTQEIKTNPNSMGNNMNTNALHDDTVGIDDNDKSKMHRISDSHSRSNSKLVDVTTSNLDSNLKENAVDDEETDLSSDDEDHLYRYHGGMSIMGNVMAQNLNSDDDGEGDPRGMEQMYDDEDYCFSCGDGGSLLICDEKDCLKVWHIHCAGLTKMPTEDQWYCPSHSCCICREQGVDTVSSKHFMCSYCATAYCDKHCPSSCTMYRFANIEFLCETCLSTNDGDDALKFATERFESRLMELHKRKQLHLLRIQGKRFRKEDILKSKNIIPSHCKLGRTEIEWFDLYRSVIAVGGLGKMRDFNAWDEVRKKVELNKNFQSENVWKSLRDDYIEYLYCYEKQYYPLTVAEEELPRGIRTLVDQKGALEGLFVAEKEEKEKGIDTKQNDGNNNDDDDVDMESTVEKRL